MRVARLIPLLLCASGSAAALSAQIPTKRPGQSQSSSNAPRQLVGNPHSFSPQDSAPAVVIGDGLRTRIEKLASPQFRVLTRVEMNDALKQFGYPADAILAPNTQRVLAQALNARVVVISTLSHDPSGKYVVTSRLAGINDEAGNVVTITQAPGQPPAELGSKLAEGFGPALKAWPDAKGCVDQLKTAPVKATESAKKALAQLPTNGLANYCLGQLALAGGKKADSAEAMRYFSEAVKGDPLSLNAWTQLASGYEVAGDTAKTVDALLQMLRIAPTNQPLRDLVFKKLLAYGKPELAEGVADEGLKLDSGNPDLYDLRANARIFRENYNGALDDLDQIVQIDSARADSTFYVKYLVTATASEKPDTARIIKNASTASRKFPEHTTLLKQVIGAYSQVGKSDSLLVALTKLVKVDSAAAVAFALNEAKNRQDQKQFKESDPFIAFVAAHGDVQARDGAAGFMLQGVLPLLQPPPQWAAAADSLRAVKRLANPTGRLAPIANYFLGLSLVNLIVSKDQEAEKQKSCDAARQVEALSAEADSTLAGAAPYIQSPQGQAQEKTWHQLQGYVTGLRPRTASMMKVYCK
jgi:tetratricopeptide (TPR) repeat protein